MTGPGAPDRDSRFADVPTYRVDGAADVLGGGTAGVELHRPRLRVQPPAATRHRVAATDRLDLLAHTYLGDPHQYWRIADANPDCDVDDLLEPGRTLQIPGPAGASGTSGARP